MGNTVHVAFSDSYLAVALGDETIEIWSASSWTLIHEITLSGAVA